MTVFLNYDQAELDRQFDQRAWAPNASEVIRRYGENSDSVRARLGEPETCAYGGSAFETLDLYRCQRALAPLHVFLHGGAWRLLSKRESAFAAELFVRAGAHFAALDFAPLPTVTLTEMARQVRQAIAWCFRHAEAIGADRRRIFVSGHSSGAHLAALLAVTDWAQFGMPAGVIKGAICASGIYDLRPVRLSARNAYVQLSSEMEQLLSPLRHVDDIGCELIVAVAELESDEFRRQASEFVAAAGGRATLIRGKGFNHFELVETLAHGEGLLGAAALAQMRLPPPGSAVDRRDLR
jgi:arylformamidase